MERPVKGDIVVIPFPFSDLSDAKRRPALVSATLAGEDIILPVRIFGIVMPFHFLIQILKQVH